MALTRTWSQTTWSSTTLATVPEAWGQEWAGWHTGGFHQAGGGQGTGGLGVGTEETPTLTVTSPVLWVSEQPPGRPHGGWMRHRACFVREAKGIGEFS